MKEFAREAQKKFGQRIHEIVLYGSVAHGEAAEQSDVDVLVVLDEMQDTDELFQLVFDIGMDYEVAIIANLQTKEHFESRQEFPFLRDVLNEGQIYG